MFSVSDGKATSDVYKLKVRLAPWPNDNRLVDHHGILIKLKKGGAFQLQSLWFASDITSVGILLIKTPVHGSLILKSSNVDKTLVVGKFILLIYSFRSNNVSQSSNFFMFLILFLPAGSELSKKDLVLGNYFYAHKGSSTANDSLQFFVSDGNREMKPVVNIQILDTRSQALAPDTEVPLPYVGSVSVNEGSAVLLSSSDFELMRGSSSKQITFIIVAEASHGHLEKMINPDQYEKLTKGSKFLGLDLKNNIIRFVVLFISILYLSY